MIDLKKFRENPEFFVTAAASKGAVVEAELILSLDAKVRALKQLIQRIKAKKNDASAIIPKSSPEEKTRLIEAMRALDKEVIEPEQSLKELEGELDEKLYRIPNPPLPEVIVAASEDSNEVLREVGVRPNFDFPIKDHVDIAKGLGILDLDQAAKASGSRFAYLLGLGAKLELALVSLAIEVAESQGFIPVSVPHLVTAQTMKAMGFLEHGGQDEIYYLPKDNLYLIGTSEQALGALHEGEILDLASPKRYVGFSPCYRREAGSHGKDTKGILRMHQFTKVEMFSFCTAEQSGGEHDLMLAIEEELLGMLGLPYHLLSIVSGDLGLPAAKKWDLECWIPSQERFRETHSTSNCTDFQARRLNIRYSQDKELHFAHTVNGTALAIGRILIAILENFQQADGSVVLPRVLAERLGQERLVPGN